MAFMARPLRIDQAETFYHVLNRGNERHAIFRDERDYAGFLDRLGRCSQRFGLGIYAYVLMGNHYHLLVKTHEANLSAAMQWLQMAYGSWHNHRHQRSGHLFQGRFKSFLIQEMEYLHRLLLYIHRNPLRAKAAERLEDYPWSSYHVLAHGRGGPTWFDPRPVYELFDLDGRGFRRAVRCYDERADDLFSSLYYGLVLGSLEVVEELRQRVQGVIQPDQPQLHALQSHGTVDECLADYRRELGIQAQEYASLLPPIRHQERPLRDVLMYLLWREGRFRLAEIGSAFGVKYSAVSQACRRAEHDLKTDGDLRKRMNTLLSNCKLQT
ncbi:MAG: transposase [Phycisphaerae bacterium]|nr:transposase [Phycisphaerae bacterium]